MPLKKWFRLQRAVNVQRLAISLLTLAFAIAVFATCSEAEGGIISFMPGDAFFHTELTEDVVATLPTGGGDIELKYSYPPAADAFCGYAGFTRIKIEKCSEKQCAMIRECYHALRKARPKKILIQTDKQGKRVDVEINGFHLFIYNKGIAWDQQRIGLKYNENWTRLPKEATEGERGKSLPRYDASAFYVPFLESYESVVEDWRSAHYYDELKVRYRSGVAWGIVGPPIEEAVAVKCEDVELVIVPNDDLKQCFRQKAEHYFLTMTSAGIDKITWPEHKLLRERWNGD